MADLYFTEEHEWLLVDGNSAKIGITAYAAEQLGDIVFVELPDAGRTVKPQDEVAVVESVKTASEILAPVSGEITGNNGALDDAPETVNDDAMGQGWFFTMKLSNKDELSALMDQAAYDAFVKEL
ncbi:MAG: glycine cleavage system protein H [Robiginitomaculum sp.]|nr:MAG: glycine cleavage system protein H [Robiginitomaculum sp.]